MLATLVTVVLATGPMKFAAPGFVLINVEAQEGEFFSDYFAQQLTQAGHFEVVTRNEVSALLGFERQRQLLGCSDGETSCLAEIGGALGVEGLVTGNVARFDSGYVVTVKILSATDARSLATYSGKARNADQLLEWLEHTAAQVAQKLERKRSAAPPAQAAPQAVELFRSPEQPRSLRSYAWIPGAVGAATVAAGVTSYVVGSVSAADIAAGRPFFQVKDELDAATLSALRAQQWGVGLSLAGVAVLGVAGGLYVWGEPGQSHAAIAPSPNGVTLSGVFR